MSTNEERSRELAALIFQDPETDERAFWDVNLHMPDFRGYVFEMYAADFELQGLESYTARTRITPEIAGQLALVLEYFSLGQPSWVKTKKGGE